MRKKLLPIILLLTFTSCSLLDLLNKNDEPETFSDSVSTDGLPTEGIHAYLLLTNPKEESITSPGITYNGATSKVLESSRSTIPSEFNLSSLPPRIDAPKRDFTHNRSSGSRSFSSDIAKIYNVNDIEKFNVLTGVIPKKVYEDVYFKLLSKTDVGTTGYTLYIWSDNNDLPSTALDQDDSIVFLAEQFDKIIKDMENLYGKHWGQHNYTDIISGDRKDIHVMLMDIGGDDLGDGTNGTIYGYFSNYDLLLNIDERTDSNECVNLFIDSHLYFNKIPYSDGTNRDWSDVSIDTTLGISTLIHEYQHAIHYYNKSILKNNFNETGEDIFVNEMFSMVSEDLLAYKYLIYKGSDGTSYIYPPDLDRIPEFNTKWHTQASYFWEISGIGSLTSYANAYTLGAYLIRNYSATFLKNYLSSSTNGIDGLLDAINSVNSKEDINRYILLHNFGTAVLKSQDKSTVSPYKFNDYNSRTTNENFQIFAFDLFNNYGTNGFKPYSLSEYNNTTTFLGESNIYIDLGIVKPGDKISINYGETEQDLVYSLVY